MEPRFKRVLYKISGEVLAGGKGFGFDSDTVYRICREIGEVINLGVQVGLVVGGGNIFRGGEHRELDRVVADNIGMLATVINAMFLRTVFDKLNIKCMVMAPSDVMNFVQVFDKWKAIDFIEKGGVVIFSGGTGNPFFTTDTAAALRAVQIEADAILKGTKVDGVYSRDPEKYPDAVRYSRLSYMEAIEKRLKIMDLTAFSFCMEHKIPIVVFSILKLGNIKNVVLDERVGTFVGEGK